MVSSHLLSEMQLMCDRVGIIADGRLIGVRSVSELMSESEGKHQFEIRVKGNVSAAAALIDDKPVEITGEQTFHVTVANEDEISGIITRLVINQVKLITVTEATRNLEEVFIELTGGEGGHQIG